MSNKYRTLPQVKFKEFRDLERRRIETSDMVWSVIVGSKLAAQTLRESPNKHVLLADKFPDLPHAQRMNQNLDRTSTQLSDSESQICAMAFSFTFGLHEDFVRTCLKTLSKYGVATNKDTKSNSDTMHETLARCTGHAINADSLELFHLTRKIRNAHLHAAGLVNSALASHYKNLNNSQVSLWIKLTGKPLQIPAIGESAVIGASELVGSLAVQKRLAYDVNLSLQRAISRENWADIAVNEYFSESNKTPKDPSFIKSAMGYLKGGFVPLKLTKDEIAAATERLKKGEVL